MKKKKGNNLFISTNAQKVLSFLAEKPDKDFFAKEIQRATKVSKAGVYFAIADLIKLGLVVKKGKGRFLLYSLNYEDPIIKQFKVLKNILLLRQVISELKKISKKIILFGSASTGDDTSESDIDLFIITSEPQAVKEVISSLKIKRKIQAVVKTPTDIAEFKVKEQVFWNEVERGIILWEQKE